MGVVGLAGADPGLADNSALKYCEVPAALFRINDIVDRDVYLLYQGQYILYKSRGQPWKAEDTEKLKEFGVQHLFLKLQKEAELHDFLDNKLNDVFEDPKIAIPQKAKILYSTSVSAVEAIFKKPESPETVKRSVTFVKHCINYLGKDRSSFYELFKNSAKNFSEYSHALHVAAYAITLAKQIGFRTANDSLAIGLAAILHDIGKTRIDRKILDKKEALDESEIAELRKHAEYGYHIVREHSSVPDISHLIILQHHERSNGKGYPSGLKADIHIFSKIIAISDTFDALTSERPYRTPMKSLDAVKYMLTNMKEDFEQSILINFIRMLQG